jgi:Arc/MetJ-type ribon-helix-helix transcriptional regulator
MASATLKVSLSKEQLAQVTCGVDSGQYASASEVVRQALREWLDRRIKADVVALEKNHKGAWERDTTPEEEALILAAKRVARAELLAKGKMTRKCVQLAGAVVRRAWCESGRKLRALQPLRAIRLRLCRAAPTSASPAWP